MKCTCQHCDETFDAAPLGGHRLMCGDSRSLDEVRWLCAGIVPDLANCDPPYGISVVKGAKSGHVGRTDTHAITFGKVGEGKPHPPFAGGKSGHVRDLAPLGPALRGRVHGPARRAIIKPGIYSPVIGDDSTETAIAAYDVLTALGVPAIVLWGGNYFANALPPSRCWLVWDKENTDTFADAELAWTNQDAIVQLLRHQWSGLMKASERGERRVHPTQKPVALAEWVIETVAPKAKVVADFFLGSGSTLIACEQRNIRCVGMELAPAYIDCAVIRWENFTGKSATHEKTRRTFAEVAAGRKAGGEPIAAE